MVRRAREGRDSVVGNLLKHFPVYIRDSPVPRTDGRSRDVEVENRVSKRIYNTTFLFPLVPTPELGRLASLYRGIGGV